MLRYNRALLIGLGLGIGLMYFLDPQRGRRRRALVRDKLVHSSRVSTDALGAAGVDLGHRVTGLVARARSVLTRKPVDDSVLVERVRAKLGRTVSHPHAISVVSTDGVVRLHGPVLQSEIQRLIRTITRVRGVHRVINQLDAHSSAGHIPALQSHASAKPVRKAEPAAPETNVKAWQRG
jgi:BON domain-containing protein